MTRRKTRVSLLKEIASIRALQLAASESDAARASSALVEKSRALERSESDRAVDEEHWRDRVRAANFDLDILPLWTGVVMRRDLAVRHAAGDVETARSARDSSISDLHAAERRSDIAEDLARRALREHLRNIERDALQDAADHHLQRRREE